MKIKGLTYIAIICLTIVFVINFTEFKIVNGIDKADKIEALIENLCLSYIAGYMFFFLNNYLVERKEKKHILPFVARNVIGIIVNNYSIINCINGNMKMALSEYPTLDELKVSLSKIYPKNKLPLFYKNENWIYLFKNRQKLTIQSIERILLAGKHIDEELRSILLNMYSSLYLKEEYAFNSDDFEDEDLSKYSRVIKTHFDLVEKLNSYYNKNLKKYYVFNQK
jgi:hypothetical protein